MGFGMVIWQGQIVPHGLYHTIFLTKAELTGAMIWEYTNSDRQLPPEAITYSQIRQWLESVIDFNNRKGKVVLFDGRKTHYK